MGVKTWPHGSRELKTLLLFHPALLLLRVDPKVVIRSKDSGRVDCNFVAKSQKLEINARQKLNG